MTKTPPDLPPHDVPHSDAFMPPDTGEDTRHKDDQKQQSKALSTSLEAKELPLKGELRPFVGIRQYANTFSPKLANPGFIKRSRLIFDVLRPKLIQDYSSWYIAIEPDSGDYFIDPNKAVAQQKARQKYPERIICTLQLIERGAERKV